MTTNILIAEDNEILRKTWAAILEKEGYAIIHAVDGRDAIEKVKANDIALALVDVQMEPMGGLEFIRYLSGEGYTFPNIIITGDQGTDLLVKARELGVPQMIQKPVDPARLIKTVERVLERFG